MWRWPHAACGAGHMFQVTTSVTCGLLPCRRVTTISPAVSRSRSTRRLTSRLAPPLNGCLLGSENVRLFAFQERCSSSMQTRRPGIRVALAAACRPPPRNLHERIATITTRRLYCWLHHRFSPRLAPQLLEDPLILFIVFILVTHTSLLSSRSYSASNSRTWSQIASPRLSV